MRSNQESVRHAGFETFGLHRRKNRIEKQYGNQADFPRLSIPPRGLPRARGRVWRGAGGGAPEAIEEPPRERIRATIAAAPPSRRRLRVRMPALLGMTAALVALVALVAAGGLLALRALPPPSPRRSPRRWPPTVQASAPGTRPPRRHPPVSSATWPGAARVRESWPACRSSPTPTRTHRTVGAAPGGRTTLPQAHGASHQPPGTTWTAKVEGLALFCADHPAPSLLLGDDRAEVLAAAQHLGLH